MSKFNAGQSFADGDTVTGAKLNNITGLLDIYTGLISEQTAMVATVSTADQLLIADTDNGDSGAANRVTVQKLFSDSLTNGTFASLNLTGTITSNRTVATSATITTGTIPNLTAGTTTSTAATITNGTIPTLTTGTTTSTAEIITSGTIATLNSTTGTITNLRSTTGTVATLNSTTGTIANLSTTLAGDFTISQGTGTLGTTGATASTYGTTSAIPVLTVDAKGRVTSGTSVTSPVGFRNRIINGDMRIDQRNSGSAVTIGTGTAGYTLDRFFAYQNSPSTLVQVSRNTSAPSGFQNSIKWGRNGSGVAGGITVLGQALETSNSIDAQGGTVTLSFYAKAGANFSAASSQIGVALYSGTGTDQSVVSMTTGSWTGSATPINSGATLTTSWQRFTFTSTTLGATVSQLGIYISWTPVGVAGADDNVYITGIQLETGSNATDFERRPYGMELALCQRYYELLSATGTGQGAFANSGYGATSGVITQSIMFKATKRTTPTIAIGGTWGVTNSSQPSVYSQADGMCVISITVTATGQYSYIPNSADDVITASSEL
jgi:hypothetical protein